MKCPYCGSTCPEETLYCPNCKQPLPTSNLTDEDKPRPKPRRERHSPFYYIGLTFFWIACLAALGVGIYKLITWVDNYNLTRLYTRGAYAPTLSVIDMEDRRQGHAIVFYGNDGDQVFLPELNRSLTICGGVARLEVADADWFSNNTSGVEKAEISLSPQLISEKGEKTELPIFDFEIDVPYSPLEITTPASDRVTAVTSVYPLELEVVAGSTVFINGQDVTGMVDRNGNLSTNVGVEPIGDNIITVIARTDKHSETRKDITIYRQQYDIEIELDTSVKNTSNNKTMAITGRTEPGAMISIDTDHIAKSVSIDMETGEFSFIAKFSTIGDNIVRFRATREGDDDAVISFTVYYLPTLAEYSADAWRMDYAQLRVLFEQWHGRKFQCKGEIIDMVVEDDATYLIMDVGDETQQLVVLKNLSSTKQVTLGRSYEAWADVDGRYMYKANYYPMLIARYMDMTAATN